MQEWGFIVTCCEHDGRLLAPLTWNGVVAQRYSSMLDV
jgi:hypothetical protein